MDKLDGMKVGYSHVLPLGAAGFQIRYAHPISLGCHQPYIAIVANAYAWLQGL